MCLGLANGCTKSEKESVSLLKKKTNYDRIKEMTVDEMAEFLEEVSSCQCSVICSENSGKCDYANLTFEDRVEYCHRNIKQWLESEEEE